TSTNCPQRGEVMVRVGIWERDEGLFEAISRGIHTMVPQPELLRGRHPAELCKKPLDLLVISPHAAGWAGVIKSRIVLLPGSAGALCKLISAESAVSYGTSPQDTLTLSSLEGEQICVALQRELVTVGGIIVERQELVLPYPAATETPPHFMAQVGALLLLGCSV
ncbi:MAG: hypothetical protein RR502_10415, partial [Oscillospiraceae bacterium]